MPGKFTVTIIPPVKRYTHRAGIYSRVSTTSQELLNSLSYQVSWLARKVDAILGRRLFDAYLDIRSGSSTASRNEFQRMLEDCRGEKT